MRRLSNPASGSTSGRALSASSEPPGRSGASHSSQATHSAIRASRLATAAAWVRRTWPGRVEAGDVMEGALAMGVAS